MSNNIIEIYGTACIYEWGVVSDDQKEILLKGTISEDEFDDLSDEVLSENTETSFLFDTCAYEIQIDGEAVELDESNMMKALKEPIQFASGSKGDFFLVKKTELEGFLLSYELDEAYDPSKLEFHSTEHSLGNTNHTVEVLDFEYVGAEREYGNPDGFASLHLIGPDGFSQSVEIEDLDIGFDIEEVDEEESVERVFTFDDRAVFLRYKDWVEQPTACFEAESVEFLDSGDGSSEPCYIKLVGTKDALSSWPSPFDGGRIDEKIGEFSDSWY